MEGKPTNKTEIEKGEKTVEANTNEKGIVWDKEKQKDALFEASSQRIGSWVEMDKLREEFKDKPVLNGDDMNYLLENQHSIPEEWKGKTVLFVGTKCFVYGSGSSGEMYCLCWDERENRWKQYFLDLTWREENRVALRAS